MSRPPRPARPRFEPLAALDDLRRAAGAHAAAAAGRVTAWLSPPPPPDARGRRALLRLEPMDHRNPPSEGLLYAGLPLAAAVAAVWARHAAFEAAADALGLGVGSAADGPTATPAAVDVPGVGPADVGGLVAADPEEPPPTTGSTGADGPEVPAPPAAVNGGDDQVAGGDGPLVYGAAVGGTGPLAPAPNPLGDPLDPSPPVSPADSVVSSAASTPAVGPTTTLPRGPTGSAATADTPDRAAAPTVPAPMAAPTATVATPEPLAPASPPTVPLAAPGSPASSLATSVPPASTPTPLPTGQAGPAFGRLPLRFEANAGQLTAGVDFAVQAGGYDAYLTPTGVQYLLYPPSPSARPRGGPALSAADSDPSVLRIDFDGANPAARGEGLERLATTSNYYVGRDPAGWHAGIPNFARVAYDEVYQGIDVVYYEADGRQLEYDLVVAPGADPGQVRMQVSGADGLRVDADGDLIISTPVGELIQTAPVAYQDGPGGRQAVAAAYQVTGDLVTLALGLYDSERELVIDPVVEYATSLPAFSMAYGVAVDGDGSAYVVGDRFGGRVLVGKVAPDGHTVEYYTTFGDAGPLGSASKIAIDAAGSAYVVGRTSSSEFPTLNAYQSTMVGLSDGFVIKLTPGGSLEYSTYLNAPGHSVANDVAIDGDGAVYVVGTGGLVKLAPDGQSAVYTNALGGSQAFGVAIDAANAAYVVGGFGLKKISPDGQTVVYTNGDVPSQDVAVDASGAAYVGNGSMLTKVSPGGLTDWTFADLVGYGVALDSYNRVYVPAYQAGAAVVSVVSADGQLIAMSPAYDTYMYTSTNDIAVDATGGIYLAGRAIANVGIWPDGAVVKLTAQTPAPAITGFADDSGASTDDRLTNDVTPILFGTTSGDPAIDLYYRVGASGTYTYLGTTAATSGLWTYTHGTALSQDGTYEFTATATAGAATSARSAPYAVTLDTAPPVVTLALDASPPTSTQPVVRVTATDPHLDPTGTVALDVDLNADGDFDDPGELGYMIVAASAPGYARFRIDPALAVGTYALRARLLDRAGNEGATVAVPLAVVATTMPNDLGDSTPGLPAVADVQAVGNLKVEHALDTDLSPGLCGCQVPRLTYNSAAAAPAAVVQVALQSDNTRPLPAAVVATLTWDGGFTQVKTLAPGGMGPLGEVWTFGFDPIAGPATGRHTYTVDLFVDYAAGADVTRSLSGSAFVIGQAASPFGPGWTFSNVDALVTVAADPSLGLPAGLLRTFGGGGGAFYAWNGSGYDSPAGDAGALAPAGGGGWTYTDPEGRTRTFDAGGRMTGWASADGAELFTYAYDGSGRLESMTAPDSGVATFAYDGGGLLETVRAPAGRTTTVTRDLAGDMTGLEDPAGGLRTFAYDGHRLTGDRHGVLETAYEYEYGMLSTVQRGDGPAEALTPAAARGQGTAVSADGGWAVWSDGGGGETWTQVSKDGYDLAVVTPAGRRTAYERDAGGYATLATDDLGRSTAYTRDGAGYVTGVLYADGARQTYAYDPTYHTLTGVVDELGRTTTYGLDVHGRVSTVTTPDGAVTTVAYAASGRVEAVTDPLGRAVTYQYDGYRRLVRELRAGTPTATALFDAYGEGGGATDPLGFTTTVVNDAVGRPVGTERPDGSRTTATYDASGLVLSETRPSGGLTTYAYDGAGRATGVTEAAGTGLERRTTYAYDDAGRLLAEVDPLGRRTTYQYDADGRVAAVTGPTGATTTTVYDRIGRAALSVDPLGRVTAYAYDDRDRVVAVADPLGNVSTTAYDAAGQAVAETDPTGRTTTYVYDDLGRRVAAVDPLGNRTTTAFDAAGQAVASVDSNGNATTYHYDVHGRLEATEDALGRRTTTVYDAADRVLAIVDPLGRRTTYGYDPSGRQVTAADPLGKVTTIEYDAYGRAEASVDPNGNRTTFVYDALDRRVAVVDALGNRTTTVYDAADRAVATVDPLGRRTTAVYDAADRVTSVVDPLGGQTRYAYDPAGQLLAETDARGAATAYRYDAAGRPVAVIDALERATVTGYDGAGRVTSVTDPLGAVTGYAYDGAGRLEAVVEAAGTGVERRTTYVYDDAGNRLATVDPLGRRTTAVYDALNRPYAAVDPLGHRTTTAFDAAGQATAVTDPLGAVTGYAYDGAGRLEAVVEAAGTGVERRTTYVYDDAGNRLATVDPLGRRTTAVYDALNRPHATIDPLGHRTTTTFDAAGQATAVTDPLGRTTTYAYDALGRPVATTDPNGGVWTTVYDAAGNPVAAINPLGQAALTSYDALGRVRSTGNPAGETTLLNYDAAGNATTITDPLGRTTTTAYDTLHRPTAVTDPLGNVTTTVYDSADQVVAMVDARGNRTTYAYDDAGRLVGVEDALNHRTTFEYDAADNRTAAVDALGRRTTTAYDPLGRPVETTNPLGGVATAVYDAADQLTAAVDELGRRTTFAYDDAGRRTETTDALGGVATAVYDAAGQVLAAVDPLGGRTTFGYDAAGRRVTTINPLNRVSTAVYDAAGRQTVSVDPLGNRTTYAYDAAGRVVAVTDPLGHTATTVYDPVGNAVAAVDPFGSRTTFAYDAAGRRVTATDPLGNVTTTAYDAAGNVTAVTTARGHTTGYQYDALNRRFATTDALSFTTTTEYDAVGNVAATVDQLGHRTTYAYDALDRLVTVERPTGAVLTTGYDAVGNATAATDALGHTTTTAYDALDRAVAETDPLGGVTTFAYDALGRRTALTDAAGNATTWAYDAAGQVVSETDPLGAAATFAYDAAGRRTGATDRLGRRREWGYDAAGRTTSETWYDALGAAEQTQTFAYDAAGRQTAAADPDGAYTLAYDAAGRVTVVEGPFGAVLTFGYDADGNRTSVEDSFGGQTATGYDALGRVSYRTVSGAGATGGRFAYTYTARGEVESLARFADAYGYTPVGWTSYAYDSGGRAVEVAHADALGATLALYTYAYDPADRLTAKTEDGVTTAYGYDAADQLTADGAATFGYDPSGNRTGGGSAVGAGNRVTTDGLWTYTYDAAGAVVKKSQGAAAETWEYGHDQRGQMVWAEGRATDGGTLVGRVEYAYDAWGNRVGRTEYDGSLAVVGEERYALDGWDTAKPAGVGNEHFDAWADLDGTDALVVRRQYGPGFDQVVMREDAGGAVGWYATDRQGSVRNVLDAAGAVAGTLAYDGYGVRTAESGDTDRYGYTGREWDGTLGLQFSRMRWYDPAVGRWYSADPIGFEAGDVNLYRYVGNGPTNWIDPSGLQSPGRPLPTPPPTTPGVRTWPVLPEISPEEYYSDPNNPLLRDLANAKPKPWMDPVRIQSAKRLKAKYEGAVVVITKEECDTALEREALDEVMSGKGQVLADTLLPSFTVGRRKLHVVETSYGFAEVVLEGSQPNLVPVRINPVVGGKLSPKLAEVIKDNFTREIDTERFIKKSERDIEMMKAITPLGAGNFADAAWFWDRDRQRAKHEIEVGVISFAMEAMPAAGKANSLLKPWRTTPQAFRLTGPINLWSGPSWYGRACFSAGTPLLTPAGSKPIEEFRPGDLVLSRHELDPNGEVVPKAVEEVFRSTAKILALRVGAQTVSTTAEHPFWVQDKGWLPASELVAGERLLSHDGQWVVVSEIVDTGNWAPVFNLRVADFHTYFVGGREWGFSIWAHNAYFVRRIEGTQSWTLVNEAGEVAPVAVNKKWGNPKDVERFAESQGIEGVVRDTKTTWQPPRALDLGAAAAPTTPTGPVTQVDPFNLEPTHFANRLTDAEFNALKSSIRQHGILEPIVYVVHNGRKHIVAGHHRVRAAKEIGLNQVPTVEVQLPYGQYRTPADLAFDYGSALPPP